MTISEKSLKIRGLLGLNQSQMGQLLGVSRNYVSMIEDEENPRTPSKAVLLLLEDLAKKHLEQISPNEINGARSALKAAREKAGMSQAELAKAVGYSLSTYQNIEDGGSQMGEKMARKVAKALNINVSILMDGADEPTSRSIPYGTVGAATDNIQLEPGMSARFVPLLSWAQCGRMMAYDDSAYVHDGFMVFNPEDRQAFAVTLSGDSMLPEYRPGDVAVVYPNDEPRNGDVVIARLTDKAGGDVMFKLYHRRGDLIKLTSLNTSYPPMDFHPQEFVWIYPVDSVHKKLRQRN